MARAASRVQRYEEKYFRGRQLFFHALQLELRLASCRPMDAEFCDLTVFRAGWDSSGLFNFWIMRAKME